MHTTARALATCCMASWECREGIVGQPEKTKELGAMLSLKVRKTETCTCVAFHVSDAITCVYERTQNIRVSVSCRHIC